MSSELRNNLYKHFKELFPSKEYNIIIKRAINIHISMKKQHPKEELQDLINNYIHAWSYRNRIDLFSSFMNTNISIYNINNSNKNNQSN